LCESNGGAFGTGHVDFMAVGRALNQIGYTGFASVKVYRQSDLETAARESIDYLRRIGFAN
jgi:sugar phosphate isomerase/epimerase